MRLKKGTKVEVVEVLRKGKGPSGSWCVAEIISGNGRYYNVKYDRSPSGINALAEGVPRKDIRPCPHMVQGPICWIPGDLVEIFCNSSWKLAEVSSVASRNEYFVRLLGSSEVLKVHESDLRVGQSWDWEDNRWVAIRKDTINSDEGQLSKEHCLGSPPSEKVLDCANKMTVQKINWVFSGGKKRGLELYSYPNENCNTVKKKLKARDKENRHQQLAALNSCRLQKKCTVTGALWRDWIHRYSWPGLHYGRMRDLVL